MPSSHPRHARASSPAPGALAPLSLEGIPLGNIYADILDFPSQPMGLMLEPNTMLHDGPQVQAHYPAVPDPENVYVGPESVTNPNSMNEYCRWHYENHGEYTFSPTNGTFLASPSSEGTSDDTNNVITSSEHLSPANVILVDECRATDPALQRLALHLVTNARLRPLEVPEDFYIAQYFRVTKVSGDSQPSRNGITPRTRRRPSQVDQYDCRWCEKWRGSSKEKARQHFLTDLCLKPLVCTVNDCTWSTARQADLDRHLQNKHSYKQPGKRTGGAQITKPSFQKYQDEWKELIRLYPAGDEDSSPFPSTSTNSSPAFNDSSPMDPTLQYYSRNVLNYEDRQVRTETQTWYSGQDLGVLVRPNAGIAPVPEYNDAPRRPAELLNSNFPTKAFDSSPLVLHFLVLSMALLILSIDRPFSRYGRTIPS